MPGKSSLIMIIGYLVLFGIISGSLNQYGTDSVKNSASHYERIMAKNLVDSGINLSLRKLSQNHNWRDGFNNYPFAGGTFCSAVLSEAGIGENAVSIKATANYNGSADSAKVYVNVVPPSNRFSRFSYFSDGESGIYFNTQDTLYGPVHTNDQFYIMGSPVFYGLVSSVSPTYVKGGTPTPHFYGGTDFGRSRIDLPIDLTPLRNAAQSGGHYVPGSNLWLKFQNDGSYLYKFSSGGSWQTANLSDINGVISCEEDVYVEGVVKGQVTVSSSKNIYINDDILCASDPRANPESTDMLGLVAMQKVIVKDNANNRIKCEINASIMTVTESFRAENIYFTPPGKLVVYGGIIQKVRGPVGTATPTGYRKLYRYDDRLEFKYPPYFPIAPNVFSDPVSQMATTNIISWYE